jgi:ornithine carbamoyltransferase
VTPLPNDKPVRHFLDLDVLGRDDLRAILDEAHRRKATRLGKPKGVADADAPLAGYALAMLFEKNSTRTRLSFDLAIRQLGGFPVLMDAASSQMGRGETVADTARVLSRMVDAVMLRANRHSDLMELANNASVPVINGLTDRSHPCQIIADLMTYEEQGRSLTGAHFAWVGDGNNVANSFIHAAPHLGFSLTLGCPAGFRPDPALVAAANKAGGNVKVVDEAELAVAGADAVIADTWVSMGDTNGPQRMQALGPYQVNAELMAKAKAEAVFLHCLPAHRGEEVTADIIDGPASLVFDEAENRLHAQKAILMWCLCPEKLSR